MMHERRVPLDVPRYVPEAPQSGGNFGPDGTQYSWRDSQPDLWKRVISVISQDTGFVIAEHSPELRIIVTVVAEQSQWIKSSPCRRPQ